MDISLGVDVSCTDGEGGHCAAVVFDPSTHVVSHLVVKTKGREHEEYLVPLALIRDTTVKSIWLDCTRADLGKLDPFMVKVREDAQGLTPMNAQALAGAEFHSGIGFEDFGTAGSGASELVAQEAIPETEIALRADTPVFATDGQVAHVDRLFVHAETGELMQIVMLEKHLLSKKSFVVSMDQIDRIGEESVHLKLSKQEAEQLPRI